MTDRAQSIRIALSYGSAHQALDLALAAAKQAGERVIADNPKLPPVEQMAHALQAADEALEGLALELAAGAKGGD